MTVTLLWSFDRGIDPAQSFSSQNAPITAIAVVAGRAMSRWSLLFCRPHRRPCGIGVMLIARQKDHARKGGALQHVRNIRAERVTAANGICFGAPSENPAGPEWPGPTIEASGEGT